MEPWATVYKHVAPRGGAATSSGIGNENFGFREPVYAHVAGKRVAPSARADAPKNECGP